MLIFYILKKKKECQRERRQRFRVPNKKRGRGCLRRTEREGRGANFKREEPKRSSPGGEKKEENDSYLGRRVRRKKGKGRPSVIHLDAKREKKFLNSQSRSGEETDKVGRPATDLLTFSAVRREGRKRPTSTPHVR